MSDRITVKPFCPPPPHCTDPAGHGPHRFGDDDDTVKDCPGTTVEDAEPAPCRSPRCTRPGVNGAGFCCHGCAAHSRFGHTLLHGGRCDDANPGVEPTADPLHAAIAAVLYVAPDSPSDTAARYRRVEAEHRADKVMAKVQPFIDQQAERIRDLGAHLDAVRALVDGHRLGTTRLIPATELAALLNTLEEELRG